MQHRLSARSLFDIPEDVAYFNCGYMSPLLRSARAAGAVAVARKSRPWEITPADFFESVETPRARFAALIGASPECIATIPAASYGMAVAAHNIPLQPGCRVLLLDEEFPSTTYAWIEAARRQRAALVLLPRPADDDWTRVVLEAIDERTAVAALPHCHWTDGGLLDLVRIRAALDRVGAALVLDATQSLGVLPLDLELVRPDFMVAACYKWLLGPYSTGFLYADPRRHEGEPLELSWMARQGSEDFSRLVEYRDGFRSGARRFDVGEPSNFALSPMVTEALRQLEAWTIPSIQREVSAICTELLRRLEPVGYTAVPADRRAGHYLGLRHPRGIPAGLAGRLAQDRIYLSVRGPSLRITPHLYNTESDLDRLAGALEAAVSGSAP
jgi:selenocysteine lyase/cysteine desulfurase